MLFSKAGDFAFPSSALGDDTLSPFLRLLPPVIHIWLLVAHNMLKGGPGYFEVLVHKRGGLRAARRTWSAYTCSASHQRKEMML